MMILGVIGGMAWAAIPAYLRTRWNANEILTSLMLTYVAQLLLIYLVSFPWRDPDGYGFPQSALFSSARPHRSCLRARACISAPWLRSCSLSWDGCC